MQGLLRSQSYKISYLKCKDRWQRNDRWQTEQDSFQFDAAIASHTLKTKGKLGIGREIKKEELLFLLYLFLLFFGSGTQGNGKQALDSSSLLGVTSTDRIKSDINSATDPSLK